LGSYLTAGRQFRCSVSYAKRSSHRATNAIFGKVGRFVSEEVLIELVRCKCMPILLYGLQCFFLPKSDVNSLDFAVRRFLMKLFKTVNNDVIQDCCNFLKFILPSDLLAVRYATFSNRYRLGKKYTSILDLNKLTLLCCSLGYSSVFLFFLCYRVFW